MHDPFQRRMIAAGQDSGRIDKLDGRILFRVHLRGFDAKFRHSREQDGDAEYFCENVIQQNDISNALGIDCTNGIAITESTYEFHRVCNLLIAEAHRVNAADVARAAV
jgi:hypothetical protein